MLQARTISRGAILTLIALTAALIILLMSGCSSDEPTPTSRPDPTRSALIQEIDRQSEQIADLQRTVEELERSKTEQMASPTVEPRGSTEAPTQVPPTPVEGLATEPPRAKVTIATPTGPGICDRSPRVQQAILAALHTNSCRVVTDDELYRITNLDELPGYDRTEGEWLLKPGDLAGLVNLETLTLSAEGATLPSGLLAGAGVNELILSGLILEPGAFDGMVSIGKLDYQGEAFPPLHADAIVSLEYLILKLTGPAPTLKGNELGKATNLHTVVLAATPGPVHGDPAQLRIPSGMFKKNPVLKTIKIGFYDGWFFITWHGGEVFAQSDLTAHLAELEDLYISRLRLIDHQPGQPPLDLDTESPLAEYLAAAVLTLPEGGRQFRDIKAWNTWSDEAGVAISVSQKELHTVN